ncbi:hypothetical protein CLU79DRAFT_593841 [Phycomyces nitens]|nr:hypothetical protein CLU79DRAFT_593841 [Phycomyces nitens]
MATVYNERNSDCFKYETFGGRESLVDPITACSPSDPPRETFIQPTKSRVVHTNIHSEAHLATNSHKIATTGLPSLKTALFSGNTGISDPEIRTMEPPTPVRSRVHLAELPDVMQQACFELPNHAQIDSVEQTKTTPNEPFSLQPAPMTPKPSSSYTRQHPQPLPPLVIPPTPNRSVSSPNQRMFIPSQRSSSFQDSPWQITPGSLTPGSSQAASPANSPLTTSPHTPSSQSLHSNHSGQTSEAKLKNSSKKPVEVLDGVEQLVHNGIKFHEAGQFEKATELFRQAAALDFPIAMFLYGVSLRHGWGCKKNEHLAFQYLQKAAEHAVLDINSLSSTVNTSASKGELIMAIYELGVSFRHGWGCKKNKETAVYFFKIAADLGDADAQNDLGHCYYNGHGTKKDLYMAAKYYRLADKQGQGIMGNSWIHKAKYDKPK